MTRKTTPPAAEDRTPLTRLREGDVHAIVGYQLAQAAIVTTQVFDDRVGHARGGLRWCRSTATSPRASWRGRWR